MYMMLSYVGIRDLDIFGKRPHKRKTAEEVFGATSTPASMIHGQNTEWINYLLITQICHL
jgi:hypothetical protein